MADDEVELDELEHHLLEDNAQDDEVEDDVSSIVCSFHSLPTIVWLLQLVLTLMSN